MKRNDWAKYATGFLFVFIWLVIFGLVRYARGDEPQEDDFSVLVNYDLSLKDAVKEGRYKELEAGGAEEVTEDNFPKEKWEKGKKKLSFKLYHFKERMTTHKVKVEMKADGYRPATLRELLALGRRKLKVQKDGLPIIALHQKSAKKENYPSLWVDSLLLVGDPGPEIQWAKGCHFMAIKKD